MSLKSRSTFQSSVYYSPEDSDGRSNSNHEFIMHQSTGRTMTVDGIADGAGRSWKIKGRMDGFGGRAILQENGKVLAVVLSERSGRCFAYKLLYPTPLCPTQKSHRIRIRGQLLYEHMTIRKTSCFSNNFVVINNDLNCGNENNIAYVVRGSSRFGPLRLKVYQKDTKQCCGAVRQSFENGSVSSSSWQIRADKNINPKIMICLTAIASKSLGKLH
ncbi:unnamed protein product [Cylindrotheca closterium]|uniref:Tubby C-terminal domain-containing protein n=1 Tax=Cylindrotheca closterium TaxID=2856 RepID=A0AAD2PVF3_9STRA|nr:unnamed protein product [Cylindrotheca closterium]